MLSNEEKIDRLVFATASLAVAMTAHSNITTTMIASNLSAWSKQDRELFAQQARKITEELEAVIKTLKEITSDD